MKKIMPLIFCVLYLYSSAQQDLGIRNSNYAGIQSVTLNPSSIADSKLKWDVNIFSVNTLFDNDFLYIPKNSLHFLGFKHIIDDALKQQQFYTKYNPQFPNRLFNVTASNEILGPSFMLSLKDHSTIGFTTSARVYSNIKNISANVAYNAFAYLQDPSLWNIDFHDNTAQINTMGWFEYGLSYAKVIYKKDNKELTAGATLKYLQGAAGAYFTNTNFNYKISDTAQLAFTNSSIDYGRTSYDIYRHVSLNNLNNGSGVGINLGFTYLHFKNASPNNDENSNYQDEKKYDYKIGVSLIDLGTIKFKNNAAAFHLETDSGSYFHWEHSPVTTQDEFDKTISAVFYNGDSSASFLKDHFNMALPAALSVQADWNVYKNYFLNTTIVKGFGHGNNPGVVRPDIYSLTPRYETQWFEFSIPLSLIYYRNVAARAGFAMRIGYVFFGGDAMGSLLKLNDFYRTDFYAGIHYFVPYKKEKLRIKFFNH